MCGNVGKASGHSFCDLAVGLLQHALLARRGDVCVCVCVLCLLFDARACKGTGME